MGRKGDERRLVRIGLVWLIIGLVAAVGLPTVSAVPLVEKSAPAGDLPETGFQGQVPLADQLSGRSQLGYRKGTRLIGSNDIRGRGNNFELAFVGNCVYVTIGYMHRLLANAVLAEKGMSPPTADLPLNGLAVIDASDEANPELLRILPPGPGSWNGWEGVWTNEARGVLAVGGTGKALELYDVSQDCKNPVLKSVFPLPNQHHEMRIAPDGMTVYVADLFREPEVVAVDIADLEHPKVVSTWSSGATDNVKGIHALDISPDGNRAYLANFGGRENGLIVMDVSEIQARRTTPGFREVSRLTWAPPEFFLPGTVSGSVGLVAGAHANKLARIGGRSYVLNVEETAVRGECPWSGGRIIDVTDEAQPRQVSRFRLGVNDPANCQTVLADSAPLYSPHQVTVDNPDNATLAFVSWLSSGVRIFDIRDPAHPKEIAYYNPPARPEITNPQGEYWISAGWDSTPSRVWYRPETGHIWFVSAANGFQVIELVDRPSSDQRAGPVSPLPASRLQAGEERNWRQVLARTRGPLYGCVVLMAAQLAADDDDGGGGRTP
jgi:hypothetical protein